MVLVNDQIVISKQTPSEIIPFTGAVHPLKTEIIRINMPQGMTLLEMLEAAQPDPTLLRDAFVFIDDVEIKREYWRFVRPKAGCTVTARVIPYLRGGGGGKNPLRMILMIALVIAVFVAAPYFGGLIAGATGLSVTTANAIAGTLLNVAGTLLINAIAPIRPPSINELSGGVKNSPSLFLDGSRNTARLFQVIPSVLGFYRLKPPLGAKTFTETLGDTNRLRMAMIAGFGELELSEFQIDNTPLEEFIKFEIETRAGLLGDDPLTLYSNIVDQEGFSIFLTSEEGAVVRTSSLNADELSIEVALPKGLIEFLNDGSRYPTTVRLIIEWRKVGDVAWLTLPFDNLITSFDPEFIRDPYIKFRAAQTNALRHSIGWKTGERAQYEIKVLRVTPDSDDEQIIDEIYWTTIRTITNEDPVNLPAHVPVAKIALNIQSTDQLNSIVSSFSVLAKSVILDWDGEEWTKRASNNPASLFRHVLQSPAKQEPLENSEIDLVKLEEWHGFCETNGFTFNMVRDYESSVMNVLADIASAGRAGLDVRDGKWSVIIDQPNPITITHITPRNSVDFRIEKSFAQLPHAWRIRFPNEQERYEQDERIVYLDGFDAGNANIFHDLEFPGVTNPDHIYKQGRYHGAIATHRPERWTVTQDFESLVARRGSRVKITHDVLIVGLASGRIRSLFTNGAGDVVSISVDEGLEMELNKNYGLMIRRNVGDDVSLQVPIDAVDGVAHTVIASTPILAADAPEVGDLFGFGEIGKETEDALVVLNTPQSDFTGIVDLVPYREEIYNADQGPIPPYEPNLSINPFLPIVNIVDVITDESVLQLSVTGIVSVAVEVQVTPINNLGAVLEIQQRFTGTFESYYNSNVIDQRSSWIRIDSIEGGGTYDLRVRWNDPNLLPGPWAEANSTFVVGKSTDPQPLQNASIAVSGGDVFISWDNPIELDVLFGGIVQIRHSQSLDEPLWDESLSIGQVAQARTLSIKLPAKAGTYLARVFDSVGNRSDIIYLSTKQNELFPFLPVAFIEENPGFTGLHSGTFSTYWELQLAANSTALIDDYNDIDNDIVNWDYEDQGVVQKGTYSFSQILDLSIVRNTRLTTKVIARSVFILNNIDEILEFVDSWLDFDGTDQAEGDLQVWERHTDNNPNGSPVWSEFSRLESAVFEARAFEFEARLSSRNSSFNIICSKLRIDSEIPNLMVAAAFSPSDIADLKLWLDAADSSTITASNGLVSEWRDKSGKNNHATQADEAKKPSNGATINNLNVVAFGLPNDVLSIDANDAIAGLWKTGGTMVAFYESGSNSFEGLISIDSEMQLYKSGGGTEFEVVFDFDGNNGGFRSAANNFSHDIPEMATILYDGSDVNNLPIFYKNGTILPPRSAGSPPSGDYVPSTGAMTIGNRPSFSNPLNGKIGEILLFNRTLQESELTLVHNYMILKWLI